MNSVPPWKQKLDKVGQYVPLLKQQLMQMALKQVVKSDDITTAPADWSHEAVNQERSVITTKDEIRTEGCLQTT